MGAEEIFDGPSDQHAKWIQEKVGGVQGVVVAVPSIPAYEQAFQSVKRGGRIVAEKNSQDLSGIHNETNKQRKIWKNQDAKI
ncbi:unnamed protein product [Rotaria sordida]|uniref:Gfo/Idh/MocA-like oxidoreductase N-terminal domain-containing protein n=1 Tax=Rotaria sordida TaxID=392033 RepID=A0A814MC79_9BILA|nr:unnamed protein product [Rotaria sordida]CAF1265284.1 unnamed protein product [Rotaria sordida]